MSGMDARTGKMIPDMEHIAQSVETIFSTRTGERVMREYFGTPANGLLGENMTQAQIMRWWAIAWAALTIFEPRFVPRGLRVISATRQGGLEITVFGDFKPFAHLTFEQAALYVAVTSSGVVVRRAT